MNLIKDLHAFARKSRSSDLGQFYKTGPGEYGEGDRFIGVIVPDTRLIAKKYIDLPFAELEKVIDSPIHEERLCGLIILTLRYKRDKDEQSRKKIFTFYMKMVRAGHVNNWDLVDVSAPIIGDYLIGQPDHMELLEKLSRSKNLWQRRIAMIFTRYPAHSGRVMATARKFRSHGFAIFAMKIPSGMAKTIQMNVTARAIKRVRNEVAR